MNRKIYISFILSSRSPRGVLEGLFQNMAAMAKQPERIEAVVKIDRDHTESINYYESEEWKKLPITVKFVITDQGGGWFAIGSQVWNQLLVCSNPNSYYVMFGKDDLRFNLKDWDEKLLSYKHHFPDDIFYIRTSEFKNEKYDNDLRRMITRPDNYSVYTRKLIHLLEGVGDYWAQDTWLQPILAILSDVYGIERGITLLEDLYDWNSMLPCEKPPKQAIEIEMAFRRLMGPAYVKYTYFRIAKNIFEYIQEAKSATG